MAHIFLHTWTMAAQYQSPIAMSHNETCVVYAFWGDLWLSPIAHPHLMVRATNKRFLPTRGHTFRGGLANESHWLQPVLVFTVHCWPAQVGVDGLIVFKSS